MVTENCSKKLVLATKTIQIHKILHLKQLNCFFLFSSYLIGYKYNEKVGDIYEIWAYYENRKKLYSDKNFRPRN